MTPIQAARRAYLTSPFSGEAKMAAAITAFLDAAAGDGVVRDSISAAIRQSIDFDLGSMDHDGAAKAAILALKEAVNG